MTAHPGTVSLLHGSDLTRPGKLIHGLGEMAELTRDFDWTRSSIGPVEEWPQTLLATVNILLSSRHPMFLWWGDELIQFYNDAYRPSLGVGKHPAALGQRGRECWPEIWDAIGPQIDSVRGEGKATWNEDRLLPIFRNGRLEDVYWTYGYTPVWDEEGKISGVLVTCSETTSRVIASRAHVATQAQTLEVFQQAPAVFALLKGPEHVIEMVNALYTQLIGGRDVVGKKVREALPEAVEQGYVRILDRIWATGEPYVGHESRFDVVWTPGQPPEERYLDFVYKPMRGANGAIAGIILVGVDVTDRVKAREKREATEAELKRSEERLRLAQQAGKIASWEWDIGTGDFHWNEGSAWIYGRPLEELDHAERLFSYIHEDDRLALREAVRPALEGRGEFQTECRVCWPDGSTHWVVGRGQPVLSPEGVALKIVGINIDVTDRKLSEQALIQNEKLAAVGRLASSIAHEINNPLESVTNLLYLARMTESLSDIRHYLETADVELRRVSAIASETLRFHRQSTKPKEVMCEDLIGSSLGVHRSRLMNAHVVLEKRKRAYRPVLCFDGEIRQVISNLVVNAIDAMQSGGGHLFVRSREGHDWKSGRDGLVITVADTGPGMTKAVLGRVFEAFYTTKGIGGTGLGLWISQQILDRHRGVIRVRSSQSEGRHGTVFTVFLPFEAVER